MIESKDQARKRGVKSPDRAEAVMLAFTSNTSTDIWIKLGQDTSPMPWNYGSHDNYNPYRGW